MRKILLAAGVVALGATPFVAHAQTSTNLALSATIVTQCSGLEAPALDLGQVSDEGTTVPGSISIKCASALPFKLGFGAGANGDGPTRQLMSAGGDTVTYELLTPGGDPIGTAGCEGGNPVALPALEAVGTGATQSVGFLARVGNWAQPVEPGTYADTVQVTICF